MSDPGGLGDASFASRIRLVDEAQGIVSVSDVTMNEPLTYRGLPFYQLDYRPLPDGTHEVTLGAARDPGRVLKYLGIAVVCLGAIVALMCHGRYR